MAPGASSKGRLLRTMRGQLTIREPASAGLPMGKRKAVAWQNEAVVWLKIMHTSVEFYDGRSFVSSAEGRKNARHA
jgi:hypothetical protein